MIVATLQSGTISREEFKVLPYLDRRLYEKTARTRFSSLDTNIKTNHPDFDLRLKVNAQLRETVDFYLKQNRKYLENEKKIKVIELGASLGAISSLYVLDSLYKTGLVDKVELTLLDICLEPLQRTKKIDFDISRVHGKAGFAIPVEKLRKILQYARIVKGNSLETNLPNNVYNISLAAFTHHHLNIFDKKLACKELERITAQNGGIVVGDLTFSYKEFVEWLRKHRTEHNSMGKGVLYAIESFVTLEQHKSFFRSSFLLLKRSGHQHYVFSMMKRGENV